MIFENRNKYRNLDDESLLLAYKKRQSSAIIGELYSRYVHLVFGVSMKFMKNKFDAEDITMSVFELLPTKIMNHEIQYFKAWLYMVTKNECLTHFRKKGAITTELTNTLQSEDNLEQKRYEDAQLNILETEIEKLKETQKICIQLFYLERQSYIEISSTLKLDIKQVKSAIQNGKRNLKIKLEERDEFKTIK